MDLDEILTLDRELTDEEIVFLEQQLLIAVRAFHRETEKLVREACKVEPEWAERLRSSAASLLLNVERAHSVGGRRLPES